MKLHPEARRELVSMLTEPHEVIREVIDTPHGVRWGRLLSRPTEACAPTQTGHAPWTMHTHPEACYRRNGTYYGWPSGSDYATFLDQNIPEHWVCALEGIYVLRCTDEAQARWAALSEKEKDAWERRWDVPSDTPGRTPEATLRGLAPALKDWVSVAYTPY
jgi:hypothetical protein